MSSISFLVYENNSQFSISDMSEPESASIAERVDALLPEPKGSYWFEVDVCVFEEDEPPYGLVRCYQENPKPKNGSLGESRIPHPLPPELLEAVEGKTFQVQPKQYGVNPWGAKVEIKFDTPSKKGVKASQLIAAALKTEKKD